MIDSDPTFVGPVNLGNPVEFTMLELAELVLRLVGGKSKLSFQSLPTDDPKQRRPNIDMAQERLGWRPKVSLEDGLRETVSYFQKALQL